MRSRTLLSQFLRVFLPTLVMVLFQIVGVGTSLQLGGGLSWTCRHRVGTGARACFRGQRYPTWDWRTGMSPRAKISTSEPPLDKSL